MLFDVDVAVAKHAPTRAGDPHQREAGN